MFLFISKRMTESERLRRIEKCVFQTKVQLTQYISLQRTSHSITPSPLTPSTSTSQHTNAPHTPQHTGLLPFSSITTMDQLEQFEQIAGTQEVATATLNYFAVMYGCHTYIGKGRTMAHRIIDSFFDRNFMINCSWTGASTSQVYKIELRKYTNIINLFFKVLKQSDSEITINDVHRFLQYCLRNSARRCLSCPPKRIITHRQNIKRNKENNS